MATFDGVKRKDGRLSPAEPAPSPAAEELDATPAIATAVEGVAPGPKSPAVPPITPSVPPWFSPPVE